MATIYYESDTDPALLGGRTVAVIGYGSQGHAHALNLRDSGIDVRVGLRPGSASREAATEQGLRVLDTNAAAAEADVIVVLAPDQLQPQLWDDGLRDAVTAGNALVFGHGFSIHFGFVTPPDDVDVLMVAPKSPGHMVRNLYADGQGTPGLVAVHQDATGGAHALALSYGAAIGCARAGLLETTFAEETESDLFGEQAVLCGGMSELVQAGFETLVEAGYQPEIAYFECLHEMKLIVDFAYEKGLSGMWDTVSETAEYGGLTRGKRVVGSDARATMRQLLADVRDGTFANEWMEEHRGGAKHFDELRAKAASAQIEQVGSQLRAMMPWLAEPSV